MSILDGVPWQEVTEERDVAGSVAVFDPQTQQMVERLGVRKVPVTVYKRSRLVSITVPLTLAGLPTGTLRRSQAFTIAPDAPGISIDLVVRIDVTWTLPTRGIVDIALASGPHPQEGPAHPALLMQGGALTVGTLNPPPINLPPTATFQSAIPVGLFGLLGREISLIVGNRTDQPFGETRVALAINAYQTAPKQG